MGRRKEEGHIKGKNLALPPYVRIWERVRDPDNEK